MQYLLYFVSVEGFLTSPWKVPESGTVMVVARTHPTPQIGVITQCTNSPDSLMTNLQQGLDLIMEDVRQHGSDGFAPFIRTVHAKGVAERIANWLRISGRVPVQPILYWQDLAEVFNEPAILSLEERHAFSFEQIGKIMGWPTIPVDAKDQAEQLIETCRKLFP